MTRPPVAGQPVPWFRAPAIGGAAEAVDAAAGRWVVMLFVGVAGDATQRALTELARRLDRFGDGAGFRGVIAAGAVPPNLPQPAQGRWFVDGDGGIAAAYGLAPGAGEWLLLDPMLRLAARMPLDEGAGLFAELDRSMAAPAVDMLAPVLTVPGVLPPALCRALIADFERQGGADSGFMREEGGLTVERVNHRYKRRADHHLSDPALLAAVKERLSLVLRPMVRRAFQFDATRIERYLVACYDGGQGGHFRAHRDNTTRGTAHRRFACTINLDADAFEGGELCFPEFGPRRYRGATGAAMIFSCSLLHEAQPVTRGRRHAFLPFLYDEAAAALRERNQAFLAPEMRGYRAGGQSRAA